MDLAAVDEEELDGSGSPRAVMGRKSCGQRPKAQVIGKQIGRFHGLECNSTSLH